MTDHHDERIPIHIQPSSLGVDELVKAGVWFTVVGPYTGLYTGDLFYNMVDKRFRISGIPAVLGSLRHAVKDTEAGPFKINFYVTKVIGSSSDGNYAVIDFLEAKVSGEFMAWLDEFHSGKVLVEATQRNWEIAHGLLVWQK